jgi:hypothetical protein
MNSSLIIPIAAILLKGLDAPACACCANRGTWYEGSNKLSASETAEINRIRFTRIARTFLTEADSDLSATYVLSHSRRGRRWEFRFRDAHGKTSALSFLLSDTATSFRADLHDGRTTGGGGPLLYKELRFAGSMVPTGIFTQPVGNGPRFRLVLQGRGNNCLRAEDFKNWTLQVSGNRISHSFYGSLSTPAPAAKN